MQVMKEPLLGFLFPADADNWLAVFRIGLGFEVIFYASSLRNDWTYLLSGTARSLAETLLSVESHFVPRLGWAVALAGHIGLREQTVLSLAWVCLILAGCGLLVGLACRTSAILAWFFHLCAAKSGGFVSYGVDNFITIGLFYLMLSPLPDRYSFDWRLRELRPKNPQLLGFWRRVLQLHLCVIYFFSGLTKCLGGGWWDGSNVWRSLIRPPFNVINPEILVRGELLFPIAGIAICLLETGYSFFIWKSKTRRIWLISICGMHILIGLGMGMWLFSFVMIVLNVAAFGSRSGSRELRTYHCGAMGSGLKLTGTGH
jgi:Vitamin K-dependent gamma-carboxylase